MKPAPELLEPEVSAYVKEGWAEVYGMDNWLDHLDTVVTAISQRRMTADQLDRFAALLRKGEADALTRVKRRRVRKAA